MSAPDAPFRLTVYDKAFAYRGRVAKIAALEANPRHNQISTADFTLDGDVPRIGDLMAKGARAVLEYRGLTRARWSPAHFLMSGVVAATGGEGPSISGTRSFHLEGDFRLLGNTLGRQVPDQPVTAQSARERYVIRGPAETVVKTLIALNTARHASVRPVIVAPDLGRGSIITASLRMQSLAEVLPAVDQAGIGISVRQHPTAPALLVDTYEVGTYPRTLTERSGAVVGWKHATAIATATRVAVGGPGEGTARVYREVIDAALEADYLDVIEVARDARDVKADDPTLEAVMVERGAETLADGRPTAGLSVTLAETRTHRYGAAGLTVGNVLDLEIGYGQTVTDLMRSATLKWSAAEGLTPTPQVGAITDDPNVLLAEAIRATASATRRLAADR